MPTLKLHLACMLGRTTRPYEDPAAVAMVYVDMSTLGCGAAGRVSPEK